VVIVVLLFKEGPDRLPAQTDATTSTGGTDKLDYRRGGVSLNLKPAALLLANKQKKTG